LVGGGKDKHRTSGKIRREIDINMEDREIGNYIHKTYKGYEYIVFYFERSIMGHFCGYIKIPDSDPSINILKKKKWYDLEFALWKTKKWLAKKDQKPSNERKPKSKRYYLQNYSKLDLHVHGGLTFGEHITKKNIGYFMQPFTEGWWVGWDYQHVGDALFLPKERIVEKNEQIQEMYANIMAIHSEYPNLFKEKNWTFDEIEEDCKDAIKELITLNS
jgi:hypothetical protein